MNGQMDFYIDTLWSPDNIDYFYIRTHPELMADRVRAMAAVDDGLGFLAHLDWDWDRPLDPYRLALAAKRQGSTLGLLAFAEMTERLLQLGVLHTDLSIKAELRPVVERYRTGFLALEQQEKIEDPMRVLGVGAEVPDDEADLHALVLRAMGNDHRSQYVLGKRYLDKDSPIGEIFSPNETEASYWLHRARDNGNAYAAHLLERRKWPLWESSAL